MNEKTPTFFSRNLRAYLFAFRMEREEAAKFFEVTTQTISRWLLNNRGPTALKADGMAIRMGVSRDSLLNKDMTLYFLEKSGYISLLSDSSEAAEPEAPYLKFSKKIVQHLENQQTSLKSMLESNNELLILLK